MVSIGTLTSIGERVGGEEIGEAVGEIEGDCVTDPSTPNQPNAKMSRILHICDS